MKKKRFHFDRHFNGWF